MMWIPDSGPIIEIGSGRGNFARLVKYMGRVKDYHGYDIRERHIKYSKSKVSADFTCLDISIDPEKILKQSKNGCICSFQTFEHIGSVLGNQDIEVVKAIPEGVPFIFSVPNFDSADHKRFYKWGHWVRRYSPYLDFKESIIYSTKRKSKKAVGRYSCSFLFNTIRKGKS